MNIDMTIYQLTGSFDVYRKALLATTKKTEGFEFVVTAPKCFCIYRLKCSKAISGWMGMDGMGMEISENTSSNSTALWC